MSHARPHSAYALGQSASASGLLEHGDLDEPEDDSIGQSPSFDEDSVHHCLPHNFFVGHRHSRTLLSFPLPEKIFFDKDRALQLEHQRKREYRRKLKSPHRLTPLDHVRELYEGAGYYLRCKRDLRPATAQHVFLLPISPNLLRVLVPSSSSSSLPCVALLSEPRLPSFS